MSSNKHQARRRVMSQKRIQRAVANREAARYFNVSTTKLEILAAMALACCSFLILGFSLISCSHSQEFSVVDLTHQQNADAVYWPGNPSLIFTILNRGPTPAGYWYEANKFETAEHGGTHLDAPAHFAEGKWRVHDIPAQRLVGYGVVINVVNSVLENPDYSLGISDLQEWESKYGSIPHGAVVLMHSGWASRYPNKTLTFNSANVTDPTTFHFPGFSPDAVDWLIQHRNISMIGVDTPSTDFGQSRTFDVHKKISKANIIGLENVNNLDKIPPSGATIVVGVTKLFDGSGGPARILAMVGRTAQPPCQCPTCGSSGGESLLRSTFMLLMTMYSILYVQL